MFEPDDINILVNSSESNEHVFKVKTFITANSYLMIESE